MFKNDFQTKHFTKSNVLFCVGQAIKQDLLLSIVYICTFSGSQMLVEHIHSDGYSAKIPVWIKVKWDQLIKSCKSMQK